LYHDYTISEALCLFLDKRGHFYLANTSEGYSIDNFLIVEYTYVQERR